MPTSTRAGSLLSIVLCLASACGGGNSQDSGTPDAQRDATPSDGTQTCLTDNDCDDGLFCNGVERCAPTLTGANGRGCVAANPARACAAGQTCDESGRRCTAGCNADADGDGHIEVACGGDDCDDGDARRYPGNAEVCDATGHDEDCNPCTVSSATDGDGDADTYVSIGCYNVYAGMTPRCDPLRVRVDGSALRVRGGDCDDTNANVHPNQAEACNGLDDNCNGVTDEGLTAALYYPDCDRDGFGVMVAPFAACAAPSTAPDLCPTGRWVANPDDCNDRDPSINPSASEVCNRLDDNCNGMTDEIAPNSYYPDCDGDMYGASGSTPVMGCAPPTTAPLSCAVGGTWAGNALDCNDGDGLVNPSRGFYACGATCGTNSNGAACGPSCAVCPGGPANSIGVCAGATCITGAFACVAGYVWQDPACVPAPPPRQMAPLSGSLVTTRLATLRWALVTGTDGAHGELCRDRACTTVITTFDVVGPRWTAPSDLPVGVLYWRIRSRAAGVASTLWSPVWQFRVRPHSGFTDTSWGASPDVNGDGYDDVVAPTGVWFGSATGPSAAVSQAISITNMEPAGDINGDGFVDAVAGLAVFSGGPSGIVSPSTTWLNGSTRARAAGDVNGDGYADLVSDDWSDRVLLFLGSAAGVRSLASASITGTSQSSFGASLGWIGDGNGDGFGDIVVGAPNAYPVTSPTNPGFSSYLGAVAAYSGGSTGLQLNPSATWTGIPNWPADSIDQLGQAVGSAGDVNGDGFADLWMIWRPVPSGWRRVEVYAGSGAGFGGTPIFSSSGWRDVRANAMDVNGDGYSDLVSTGETTAQGFQLWTGSPMGMNFEGRLASAPVFVGDFNGDGYDDIIVRGTPDVITGVTPALEYPGRAAGPNLGTPVRLVGALF